MKDIWNHLNQNNIINKENNNHNEFDDDELEEEEEEDECNVADEEDKDCYYDDSINRSGGSVKENESFNLKTLETILNKSDLFSNDLNENANSPSQLFQRLSIS